MMSGGFLELLDKRGFAVRNISLIIELVRQATQQIRLLNFSVFQVWKTVRLKIK